MGMFKNSQGITSIVFEPKNPCHNICPLGQEFVNKTTPEGSTPIQAHYTNNFKISLSCGDLVPDYCDIEEWIDLNLNNKFLIIEDCVDMLFKYIKTTYLPKYLKVESDVKDAVHGPVVVIKEENIERKIINE